MPRVSVIIPTYNCDRFLGRAIESALTQTFTDREIIIVDDGSTDGTKAVVDTYGKRVRFFYQPNRGLSSARNLAIAHSTGEYVGYLDSDDQWYPTKLRKQVAFLDANPQCGMVHSDVSVIDENDTILHKAFNRETKRSVPQGRCLESLLRTSHVQVPSVLERRIMFEKTGPFDERLRSVEDYSRWILIALTGSELGYLDEPLAYYRWRSGSLSTNKRRMLESVLTMFDILFREHALEARCVPAALTVVQNHLYEVQRELAYIERIEGRRAAAMCRIGGLIKQRPFRAELYLDLFKTWALLSRTDTV